MKKLKPKYHRLIYIFLGLLSITIATFIILTVFRDNLLFFYSPTEITSNNSFHNKLIRAGGLVKKGSIKNLGDLRTKFIVTDFNKSITVEYKGILPDLFREEQGVVVLGKMNNGIFEAKEVLAKHDENYMPPEVSEAIKKSGHWKGK